MNKKAVSLIVSYAVLIVIAVGISAATYAYLKLYLPSEKETCQEGISLIIENATCVDGKLSIALKNRGLFNVSAVFIRLGQTNKTTRTQLNTNEMMLTPPLAPNGIRRLPSQSGVYNVSAIAKSPGLYTLEIQPALRSKQKLILCEKAVITEDISCTISGG